MPVTLRILLGILLACWPLVVYFGHAWLGPWPLLIAGALLLAWRLPQARGIAVFCAVGLVGLGLLGHAELGVRAYPVAVNLIMLGVFGSSLLHGQPLVEQFARLQEPDLPAAAVAYTRRVTQAWCLFFIVNGSLAAWTALYAELSTWALYNGVISYILIGIMFAGEWMLRHRLRQEAK
ncbi:COG4648 family protein [Halopseudomonas salegens]|uniref:Uncharacterized membrane protein n=1 Tax=Halopseudomonas salegens TaxID=1434072 RepID=A0A1H2GW89_9GAMM|nr:hypothetical protein [Halopseudomonas salegens]SDU23853.1 Uncharacterized membrane protein [Halopseudomonas salegens]